MSEINPFPSATHDGPSHTPYPWEIWRTVFGEEHPFQFPPLPPPPPPPHEDYTGVPNSLQTLTHQGQCSWDSAVLPESQRSTVPRLNMEFSSEEEAYGFYKKYAEQLGFKVRKGKVQRTLDGKVPHTSDGKAPINKRFFLCSKEGKRSKKVSEKTPKYERKETRTGCKAEIRIELKNGKWVIYSCSLEHNHAPERPGQTHETDICPDNSQVVARERTGDSAHVVDKEGGTAENRKQFRSHELSEDFKSNSQQFEETIGMSEHAADSRRLHSRNLMYKASNVIAKSVASEETRKIVERHLDSALQETEEYQKKKVWCTDLRGDEICCGERHCPFGKKKKIGSASSSGNEVHGS
ncbi:hypothetical protein TIFTF001_033775 [Ficus carica]|uniref:FAR1 domain-containing protein n=1 Tax=Ficus carica TaxID=3494 RepID=A0AA88J470_FICCA|nr:hypothetical protein TIFTF001_033775 [Ficus carica]